MQIRSELEVQEALAHPDWTIRIQALDTVIYDENWDWWSVLVDALVDEDPRVQAHAAHSLSEYAPVEAVTSLLFVLENASLALQQTVSSIFDAYEADDLEAGLKQALYTDNVAVRTAALTIMSASGVTLGDAQLVTWLMDEVQPVDFRLAALDALLVVEPDFALEQALALLDNSPNEVIVSACAFGLINLEYDNLAPYILARLELASEDLAVNLLIIMQLLGAYEHIKDVLPWLKDGRPAVRQQALKAVLDLAISSGNDNTREKISSLLLTLTTDADPEIRRLCLLNMGRFKVDNSWETLTHSVNDADWKVRLQAVITSGWHYFDEDDDDANNESESWPYIQAILPSVLQDNVWKVRTAAILFLYLAPDVLEDDWLSPALMDPSAAVRQVAKIEEDSSLLEAIMPLAPLNPQLRWLWLCALAMSDELEPDELTDALQDDDAEVAEFARELGDLVTVFPRVIATTNA